MDIVFENVSFRYGRRTALSEIDWRISMGITGLLGPNGAGKTTLLSLLATLIKPDQGQIRVGEHDITTRPGKRVAQQSLGFVPQRFSLAPEMRVRDTVAYAAWVNGMSGAECVSGADSALRAVGLEDHSRRRVRALSGGQRQRLGIAAALSHDPAVLVLDEPTVGLDPGQRLKLRELISRIAERRTVLISSHLLEDISRLCGHVGVLVDGRLAFDGSTEEFGALLDTTDREVSGLGSSFELAYESLVAKLAGEQ